MPESSIVVRQAVLADAAALCRLGANTFRDTFEAHNTPEDMEQYLAESFTPERQATEIADPSGTVLLAERRGASEKAGVLGYAHLSSGSTPEAVSGPDPIELKRLYVARAWHGQGVAQALMDASLAVARARGAKTVWLGVWERNPRAVAFYEKYGFTRVGEHTFQLGSDKQTDWILELPITES